MNDHQLLCFLTVQRTLNFTAAAKELKRMISAEAGTYAVSGLVVGIALGLVLNRKLYILLITHYFGAAWQVPWGCLAVIVVVVLTAVVLAVYNPVRRILMQPITATISEL